MQVNWSCCQPGFVGPPAPAIYLPSLVGFLMGAESEQKLRGDVS